MLYLSVLSQIARYTCEGPPAVNVPETALSPGCAEYILPQRPLFGIFRAVLDEVAGGNVVRRAFSQGVDNEGAGKAMWEGG